MKSKRNISIITATMAVSILLFVLFKTKICNMLLFAFLFVAYLLTLAQWGANGYDSKKPKTKTELERHLFLATAYQYNSFTNLQYGMMHHWDPDSGVFQGSSRSEDYRPSIGDKYFCCKILNIMPIDAVFDSTDNVIFVFQTFDL